MIEAAVGPKVSVVVPTYQHATLIGQCLDSILMQRTSFPVEILIGEDESNDGTREICQRYSAQHPDRIRLFLRSRKDVINIDGKPTGRSNLLKLFAAAQGEYIAWCDGDDYWTDPLKLQKQVDFLEVHKNYSMCFHRAVLVQGEQQKPHLIPKEVNLEDVRITDLLRVTNFIATSSVVFRNAKEQLPAYFEALPFLDVGLYHLLSKKGQIKCIDEFMSAYRIHDRGMWSGRMRTAQLEGWLRFFSMMWKELSMSERSIVLERRNNALDHFAHERYPHNPRRMKLYRYYLGRFRYVMGRY